MIIRIQPDEGVFLTINSFVPSLQTKVDAIDLDLTYRGREIPEAYEALLLDALVGDFSRSVRGDELDASWRIWTPLLKYLDENEGIRPRVYPYGESKLECFTGWVILMFLGSTGPEGLDEFMESYQHKR